MTTFAVGSQVRTTFALGFRAGAVLTVTNPANGNPSYTVDARYTDGHEYSFRPDELELIPDERSEDTAATDARCAGLAVPA